jgi:hypothetical protein
MAAATLASVLEQLRGEKRDIDERIARGTRPFAIYRVCPCVGAPPNRRVLRASPESARGAPGAR